MSTATLNGTPPVSAANPFPTRASSGGGGSYELCPHGSHPAHLVAIVDLGTHDESYKGETKPDVRKILFAWELSGEFKSDGSPFVVGKDFSITALPDGSFEVNEKSNLRLMLEGWRGRKFDPDEAVDFVSALGKPCLVNIGHKKGKEDKVYHYLEKVMGLPKSMASSCPARVHEAILYHIAMGDPPAAEWLPYLYGESPADVIADSKERKGLPIGRKGETPYSTSAPRPDRPPVDDAEVPF